MLCFKVEMAFKELTFNKQLFRKKKKTNKQKTTVQSEQQEWMIEWMNEIIIVDERTADVSS